MRVDLSVDRGTRQRAEDAGPGEDERRLELEASGSRVIDGADQGRDSHDEQRFARGCLRRLVECVHEHRNGDDRPTAADEAERQADQQPKRQREQRSVHVRRLGRRAGRAEALRAARL